MALDKLNLPPDQQGYGVVPGKTTVSTELDGGAPRIRKDKLGAYATVSVQWTVGPENLDYLSDFFYTTTDEGAIPFLIDLIMRGSALTTHKAYFTDFKDPTNVRGQTYVVQATLAVDPTPYVA